MPEQQNSDELFHYGIKGMKWGRRRTDAQLERASQANTKGSDDHETAQKLRKKPLKSMSNSELQSLNQRMQLEQNYSNLMRSSQSKSKVAKGRDAIETVLSVVSTANKVYSAINSPAVRQIRDVMTK